MSARRPSSDRSYDVDATRVMHDAVVLDLPRLVLVAVQDAGDDLDLVLLRRAPRTAGQKVRGRLHAGPVVLVEDHICRPRNPPRPALAPIIYGFAHGRPGIRRRSDRSPKSARACATALLAANASKLRIGGEPHETHGRRGEVSRCDERSVLPVSEQIVRCTDTVGENERETARGGLVDDDRPRSRARREGQTRRPRRRARRSAPIRRPPVARAVSPSSLRKPFHVLTLRTPSPATNEQERAGHPRWPRHARDRRAVSRARDARRDSTITSSALRAEMRFRSSGRRPPRRSAVALRSPRRPRYSRRRARARVRHRAQSSSRGRACP